MMKKLSALMMALILVFAGTAGTGSAEETLSCFVPNELVDSYNALMYSTLIDYGFGEDEDLLGQLMDIYYLEFTETMTPEGSEETYAYYNNAGWQIELSAYYKTAADLDRPAGSITYSISDSYSEGILSLAAAIWVYVLADNLEDLDINAAYDLITKVWLEGSDTQVAETEEITLMVMHTSERYYLAFLPKN